MSTEEKEVLVPRLFRRQGDESTDSTHPTPLLLLRQLKEGSSAATFDDIIEMGNKCLSYNLSYLNYRNRTTDQKDNNGFANFYFQSSRDDHFLH